MPEEALQRGDWSKAISASFRPSRKGNEAGTG